MPVAIVSAMHEELRVLVTQLESPRVVELSGRAFHQGHLHGHEVVLVLSRIGKVAAAATASTLIHRFDVDKVLLTGVAGGLGAGVNVGDVVVARELLQHDLDVSPLFPRYEVPLMGRSRFTADSWLTDGLVVAARGALTEVAALDASLEEGHRLQDFGICSPRVHEGLIVSGDRFVSTASESEELRDRLPDALAVEMEGAAIGQVCHENDVPFAVVRTISDRADDTAHVDFTRFIVEVASRYTAEIVNAWLRVADPAPR